MAAEITQSNLNLTPDEKRVYGQLFQKADPEGLQVVTGDVAVKFFERTQLDPQILGAIWQIADTENRGLLTPAGFSIVLRLIGHCQAGSEPSIELAKSPGPLPKFDGMNIAPPPPPQRLQAQGSGGPIRVPPLPVQKVNEYASLFEKAGARNGVLSADAAKQVFEKARLPNEVLARIWGLADTEGRGEFGITQFIVAMHLLASMRNGTMIAVPQSLPPALFEAASRRGAQPETPVGARPGQGPQSIPRAPLGAMSPNSTGSDWLVTPQEKARFDQIFSTIDPAGTGYISGDQAVSFFSNSNLSEDTLASIWDLANIQSEGQLNRDEFAVAMYLIRIQRTKGGDLPTTLPAKLIPPSMRQAPTPQQPFSPPRQSVLPAPPKSASEDLFGLDAINEPLTQTIAPSQTGRSVEDPFGGSSVLPPAAAAAQKTPPPSQGTSFRPFQPTSSFGQNLASHTTGGSAMSDGSQTRAPPQTQPSGGDDLLGDNDPEVSKRLTTETTELANMSNQIGNLRTQTEEVHGKRATTERDVATISAQKQELEQRLAQFRAQYEQEVREIKSLEEQLRTSRSETQKLQQEIGMIEGAHGDLKTQHQQLAAALEADQRENVTLKERTKQLNTEIAELKPQVEKMRSDARQQKGLVAINKKQVATSEAEKEKLQTEMSDLEKASAERALSPEPVASPPVATSPVASPPASSLGQSTNPFFRKASQTSGERAVSPPTYGGPSAFDSFFGPSETTSKTAEVPHTSFPAVNEGSRELPVPSASSTPEVPTPVSSPPPVASQMESMQTPDVQPPPPPESGQITSNALPLRNIERSDSFGSSVKANPPASRAGFSGNVTPTQFSGSASGSVQGDDSIDTRADPATAFATTSAPTSAPTTAAAIETPVDEPSSSTAPLQQKVSIPGAFPSETPTPISATNKTLSSFDTDGTTSLAAEDTRTPAPTAAATSSEFPPIQDIQHDDESDSEDDAADRGFDDDFTTASPPRVKDAPTSENLQQLRPPLQSTDTAGSTSQLPTPTAQQSPPSYDQLSPEDKAPRESNQFPPEFGTLLPSREMTNSPPEESATHEAAMAPPTQSTSTNGMTSIPTFSAPPPAAVTETSAGPRDEFEDAFEGLSDAKEGSEDDVDDSFISNRPDDHEFNPVFDSPAPSKATTFGSQHTPSSTIGSTITRSADNFNTFESSLGTSTSTAPTFGTTTNVTNQGEGEHNWDDIFAGLDSNNSQSNGATASKSAFDLPDPTAPSSSTLQRPEPLARAISNGTDHDDPILKSLTNMGYPRDQALSALEKYDYNLDKAADYLTSKP